MYFSGAFRYFIALKLFAAGPPVHSVPSNETCIGSAVKRIFENGEETSRYFRDPSKVAQPPKKAMIIVNSSREQHTFGFKILTTTIFCRQCATTNGLPTSLRICHRQTSVFGILMLLFLKTVFEMNRAVKKVVVWLCFDWNESKWPWCMSSSEPLLHSTQWFWCYVWGPGPLPEACLIRPMHRSLSGCGNDCSCAGMVLPYVLVTFAKWVLHKYHDISKNM